MIASRDGGRRDGDGMAVPKAEPVLKKKKLFVMPDAYVLLFIVGMIASRDGGRHTALCHPVKFPRGNDVRRYRA
jgi:hypothetical protein